MDNLEAQCVKDARRKLQRVRKFCYCAEHVKMLWGRYQTKNYALRSKKLKFRTQWLPSCTVRPASKAARRNSKIARCIGE